MQKKGLAALADNIHTSGKIKLVVLLDPSAFDPEVLLTLQEAQVGMGGISCWMSWFHSSEKSQCLFIRDCCVFH